MRLFSKKRSTNVSNYLAAGTLSAGALFAAASILRRSSRPRVNLREKVVLITGGSRGLGLSLAFQLGSLGSRLALCARDPHELEKARIRLADRGIQAAIFPCDISEESEIEPLVARVLDRFGSIDVLINNAGIIRVAPLDSLQHSDFEHAMNTMFWAPVNLSFAVFPHIRRQGSGHIVNITSLGGRVSIPHLLPLLLCQICVGRFFKRTGRGIGSAGHTCLDGSAWIDANGILSEC